MHIDFIKAAVLGIVEGLTEYLPVSSTGHLLLIEHLFGWGDDAFGKSFAILIQLGAILALLSIYFGRLWALAKAMFTQWEAARFVIGVLLAFLPAAVVGALAYRVIKSYLFDVHVVCISLIIGGVILLWVDRMNLKARYHDATAFTLPMYIGIGIIQCISMIPGVSRAGAASITPAGSARWSWRPHCPRISRSCSGDSGFPAGRRLLAAWPGQGRSRSVSIL